MPKFLDGLKNGFKQGFFDDANLRDFRHASKTFTQDGYANAPKFKWLFHVYFDIDESLLPNGCPKPVNHGLLVKNIQLPKFSVTVAEMNQYNRKRYVQTKHSYDPVSITFHDDNIGQIKKLWYDYYTYYYNDVTMAREAGPKVNINNIYAPSIIDDQMWGYLGEPSISTVGAKSAQAKAPLLRSIKIYGFNQHNFSVYTLNNPMIERFEHDGYDYYQTSATMENRMTIRYESVGYEEGALNGQKPGEKVLGFGNEGVYDTTLSPISRPGGNKTIMGPGGLIEGGAGILDDLASGDILAAAKKAANIGHTWKNPREIVNAAKVALTSGAINAAVGSQAFQKPFTFIRESANSLGEKIKVKPPTPPDP